MIQIGTPICVPAPIFNFINGNRLRQEPACRSFEGFPSLLHCCRNLHSFCQLQKKGQLPLIASSIDYGDGSFSILSQVRYNWSVFARKMHSTSEFAMIVLSKCVIHAGFVMVAWTLRGIPFQVGIWILDLISEFTFFNLVVRLSKVQQLAIFRFSPCRLSTCWTTARCSRDSPIS